MATFDAERIATNCRAQQDDMVRVLERLVVQNSYSRHREGGEIVAGMLVEELSAIDGVHAELVPARDYASHVVGTTAAARETARGAVALVGHHDTVFPPGTFEGFHVEGDIARGPGVFDMKGGLVVCLFALRMLAEHGLLERLPLRFVIVSDEEVGSPEGKALLEARLAGAACALVFEAGRQADRIITARKGTGGLVVRAFGKPGHAGNQHRECHNAIWSLARFVDRAQRLTDYERGVTVNVGKITGGISRNTVPGEAEALVDIRFLSVEDGERVAAELRALADTVALEGTRIEVEGGVSRPPLVRSEANVALFEEYAACAVAAGLGGEECPLMGGGSDASTTSTLGIPSIDGLGPRGAGFHTVDEKIEVSSLPMRLEALTRFLLGRIGA
ncbi:MAG: M20 family metallopeptidase [Myxococcota bacterium]